MFGKVIVFGLFEMIKKKVKKKRRVRTVSPGPGSASGSGTEAWAITCLGVFVRDLSW